MTTGEGGGGIIDRLWVLLGIKSDGSGLKEINRQVKETKESLLSVGTAIKAFIAGFAVKEIADIGSYFEQARIDIAGFYNALGMSSDFNAGLGMADETMKSIVAAAAAMPGEANDYIQVFRAGLPFVREALGKNSTGSDVAAFTNKLTGTMITPEMPASTIASELEMMLAAQGRARQTLPLFMRLRTLMAELPGQANLSAVSFNKMSQAARFDLINRALDTMGPALEAKKKTWDAMFGAIKSDITMITLAATKPMFDGMKKGLDRLNGALYDDKGNLTDFGQGIVDALSTGMRYLTQFLEMGGHILLWLAKSRGGAISLKVAIGLLGTALTGLAIEKTIGSFVKLLKVMTNIKLLSGGLYLALGLIAEDLYQFATGGQSVTGLIKDELGPAFWAIVGVLGVLATHLLVVKAIAIASAIKEAAAWVGATATIVAGFLAQKAAALGAAIAESAALLPITLIILAIAALGVGIYELWKHWDQVFGWIEQRLGRFISWVTRGSKAVAEFFGVGFSSGGEDLSAPHLAAGDGVTAPGATLADHLSWAPGMGKRAAWMPGDSMGGPSSGTSVTTHVVTNHNAINIRSTDPKSAAKETSREIVRVSHGGVNY